MGTKNMNLSSMRRNYSLTTLSEKDVHKNPIDQFHFWFNDALTAEVHEFNAMVLATVDTNNKPSTRVVLLKEFAAKGFVFYTNYHSDKGREIEQNPAVSACFLWLELQRQIRIDGHAVKYDEQEAIKYFASRPRESQLGAWASNQSSIISDRFILDKEYEALKDKYPAGTIIPKPPHWGGYLIIPRRIEFWQGRESRLHDRIRYDLNEDGNWTISRISP